MIRIYGNVLSRAYRCLWLCRELGLEVEHVPIDLRTDAKAESYLALNPAGKVPTLVDGDLVLTESLAINLYLVRKFGGEVAPRTPEEEAHTLKWAFWAATECERWALTISHHRMPPPNVVITEDEFRASVTALDRALPILERALANQPYLLGDRFTVADLNVASVLSPAKFGRYSFTAAPRANEWLKRCFERPAQRNLSAPTQGD